MYLAVGSYERFLFGFEAQLQTAEEQPQKLPRKFTLAAHKNAVKCVDACGKYLVSGGADDTIHLYDVKADKDLGFLMNPCDGAVPCVELYAPAGAVQPSHMFTGSSDGAVCVWQAGGDWQHLKVMRGHKGAVNSLSVHPSGKLALSVARDSHMRLWNLVKGRCQYTSTLEQEGDIVRFSPSGDAFALVCGSQVTCHNTSGEGGVRAVLSHDRRVLCVLQQDERVLLTAAEDGALRLWDLRTSAPQQQLQRAHSTRIRGLVAAGGSSTGGVPDLLATASSDGVVKLWDARMMAAQGSCTAVAQAETRARITCMAAADPTSSTPRHPAAQAANAGSKPKQQDAAAVAAGEKATASAKPAKAKVQQKQEQQAGAAAAKAKQQGKQGSKKRPGSSAAAADDGFEVVPETFDPRASKKQRRRQQQDDDDDEPGEERQQQPVQKQQKHVKQHTTSPAAQLGMKGSAQKQQQVPASGDDEEQERLVPHVPAHSTLQMKNKKKQKKHKAGQNPSSAPGISIVNKKAARQR